MRPYLNTAIVVYILHHYRWFLFFLAIAALLLWPVEHPFCCSTHLGYR
jgi:hypothetical protein